MTFATSNLVRIALGALCVGLFGIIIIEISFPLPDAAQPEAAAGRAAAVPTGNPAPAIDSNKLIAEILQRPLFTPGRRQSEPDTDEESEPEKKGTAEFRGRLAGVMLRPGGGEALFAREGEKPIAATEGQEIDGWTVDSIEADHVVISSDLGERTIEPTPGERGAGAAAARRPPARQAASAQKQKAAAVAAAPATRGRPAAPANAPAPGKPPSVKVPLPAPGTSAKLQGVRSSQIVIESPGRGLEPWSL